jgi:CheY-like chemotaxis protein
VSRILLADDSPHAQRMGERILREEGFEVVTVTDGETALVRLADVDPDVILADVSLPLKSGYELCEHIKARPEHHHRRVVLLASLLEPVDEAEATRVGADGVLRKPLEASAMLAIVRPLATVARGDRTRLAPAPILLPDAEPGPEAVDSRLDRPPAIDPEKVRAAVTLALDTATPALIEELTARVLQALRHSSG